MCHAGCGFWNIGLQMENTKLSVIMSVGSLVEISVLHEITYTQIKLRMTSRAIASSTNMEAKEGNGRKLARGGREKRERREEEAVVRVITPDTSVRVVKLDTNNGVIVIVIIDNDEAHLLDNLDMLQGEYSVDTIG